MAQAPPGEHVDVLHGASPLLVLEVQINPPGEDKKSIEGDIVCWNLCAHEDCRTIQI